MKCLYFKTPKNVYPKHLLADKYLTRFPRNNAETHVHSHVKMSMTFVRFYQELKIC